MSEKADEKALHRPPEIQLSSQVKRRLGEMEEQMRAMDRRASRRARQIANKLKYTQGLTQVEMASRAGWSQGNLAVYLSGKKPIGRNVLLRLCIALECEPHEIRPEMRDPGETINYHRLIKTMKHSLAVLEDIRRTTSDESIRRPLEEQVHRQMTLLEEVLSQPVVSTEMTLH